MSIRICTDKHQSINVVTGKEAKDIILSKNKNYIIYNKYGANLKKSIKDLKINKKYTIFHINDSDKIYNLYVQTDNSSILRRTCKCIKSFFQFRDPRWIKKINDEIIDEINLFLPVFRSGLISTMIHDNEFRSLRLSDYNKSLGGIEEHLKENIKECFNLSVEYKYDLLYNKLKESYGFLLTNSKGELEAKKLLFDAISNQKYVNDENKTTNPSLRACFNLENNKSERIEVEDALNSIVEDKNYEELKPPGT